MNLCLAASERNKDDVGKELNGNCGIYPNHLDVESAEKEIPSLSDIFQTARRRRPGHQEVKQHRSNHTTKEEEEVSFDRLGQHQGRLSITAEPRIRQFDSLKRASQRDSSTSHYNTTNRYENYNVTTNYRNQYQDFDNQNNSWILSASPHSQGFNHQQHLLECNDSWHGGEQASDARTSTKVSRSQPRFTNTRNRHDDGEEEGAADCYHHCHPNHYQDHSQCSYPLQPPVSPARVCEMKRYDSPVSMTSALSDSNSECEVNAVANFDAILLPTLTITPPMQYNWQQQKQYSQSQKAPPPPPTKAGHRMKLEVSPGVFLPLHGSAETIKATEQGYMTACHCMSCTSSLYCIANAIYVICPACRVVSPIENLLADWKFSFQPSSDKNNGVGLGIHSWQYKKKSSQQPQQQQQQQHLKAGQNTLYYQRIPGSTMY